MTREELERMFQFNMTDAFIKWDKAVNAEYKEENEETFYQGAYAAQKYLIEKACKWLKENLSEGYDADNYPMVRCYDIDMEDFIKEFSREMEE